MKRILTLPALLGLLTALTAVQAHAQAMKPGLWELNNKVKASNAQTDAVLTMAMQQLANMPPEQRAQLEAFMNQNGASMPKVGSDGGMAITTCITPEMAAKHDLPVTQKGNCTSNNQPIAGGLSIAFSCTDPASSGQGQLRYNGDSAFTMNMNVSSSAGGAPQQATVATTGRWLGATCPAKAK
jgi:hypothetical protein